MATLTEPTNGMPPRRPWLRWLRRLGRIVLVLLLIGTCRLIYRHFEVKKNLEAALAEMDRVDPGWRLENIEAARAQIPEAENSARVVVAAAQQLPKNWPSLDFTQTFANLAPEETLTPDQLKRLEQELTQREPALKEARKLQKLPRGRHRITYLPFVLDTTLNDQQDTRRVVSLLGYDALLHDQRKDLKAALIDCQAQLNAARSLGDEPSSVSQLIRIAGVIMACDSVERVLAQGEPAPEALQGLLPLLQDEDAFADLLVILRGERASLHRIFTSLESGDVPLSHLGGEKPGWMDTFTQWFVPDGLRANHPAMLTYMNRYISLAHLPMPEQAQEEAQLISEVRTERKTNPPVALFIPPLQKMSEASRRKHAYVRCIQVAIAAELHRHAKGKWADSIDTLCPAYLDHVPLDPFDGQPLRYRRLEDGILVYTVGSDGVDNSGNLDRENPTRRGVDIGYRLWDVAKRRQPAQPKAQPEAPLFPPNPG